MSAEAVEQKSISQKSGGGSIARIFRPLVPAKTLFILSIGPKMVTLLETPLMLKILKRLLTVRVVAQMNTLRQIQNISKQID